MATEKTISQNLGIALNFLNNKFNDYQQKGDIIRDIIYTGTEAPTEDNIAIWIDTTNSNDFCRTALDAHELAKHIADINNRVKELEFAFSHEISFGDFSNNVTDEVTKTETTEEDEPGVIITKDESSRILADGSYEVTESKVKTREFIVDSAELKYKDIVTTTTITTYAFPSDDTILNKKTITNTHKIYTSLNHDTNEYDEGSQVVYTTTNVEQFCDVLAKDEEVLGPSGETLCTLKAGSTTNYIRTRVTELVPNDETGEDEESTTQSWEVYNTQESKGAHNNIVEESLITTYLDVANHTINNISNLRFLKAQTEESTKTTTTTVVSDLETRVEEILITKKKLGTINKFETVSVMVLDEDNTDQRTTTTTTTKWEWDPGSGEYVVISGPTSNEVVEDLNAIPSYTPNGKHLRIKSGKYSELKAIIDSGKIPFLSGELLYCYDTNNLYIVTPYQKVVQISSSSSGSSGGSGNSGGSETIQVDLTKVDKIGFVATSWATDKPVSYSVRVNGKGKLICNPATDELESPVPTTSKFSKADVGDALKDAQAGLYLQKLYINSFYCGGLTSDKYSYNYCDYNFVELSNLTKNDINLKGLSLQYSNGGNEWAVLPLEGVIKAQSTFLIRGAKCSVSDTNTTIINVPEPDMEWYKTTITTNVDADGKITTTETRDLIAFSNITCKLLLMYGTKPCPVKNPFWVSGSDYAVEYGYIDMVGCQRKNASGANIADGYETKVYAELNSDRIFTKYYTMDPVSQATKALTARSNAKDWYFVDLSTADKETGLNKLNVNTLNYIPQPKSANKDIFYNKTHLDKAKANMVTCSFGINATDQNTYEKDSLGRISKIFDFKGALKYTVTYEGTSSDISKATFTNPAGNVVDINYRDYGATRCFNWVSVGYYNEYLFYRKKGESTWTKVESFKKNADGTFSDRLTRHAYDVYNRQRVVATSGESFTSHKYILPFLTVDQGSEVTYEYYCGREKFIPTEDDIYQFTIRNGHDVEGFGWIQVSDQQGFNEDEYRVWGLLSDYIEKKESHGSSYKAAGDFTYGETIVDGQPVVSNSFERLGSKMDTPDVDGFDFVINTGDMTQNGNRLNEWLDYYNNGKALYKKYEQMYIIGNNDLCPASYQGPESLGDGSDTSKINGINFQFFFTYEFDPNNLPFVDHNGELIYIHSLYSFNYGKTHFLAVNSEITSNTNNTFYKGHNAYEVEKAWCEYDAEQIPDYVNWRMTYCHEMPFTILTAANISSFNAATDAAKLTFDRGGSHLNTVYGSLDASQGYWFSRFLENYGYQLCMCGHKHTYSVSRNLRENYTFRWDGETTPGNELVHGQVYDSKQVYLRDLVDSGVIIHSETKNATMLSISSFIPIIQTKNGLDEGITTNNAAMWAQDARDKYNAPVYAMLQASGYKQTSNKELPGQNNPWLRSYFPITDAAAAQAGQKYPFYIKWCVAKDYCRGNPYRGENIMSSGSFNINTYKGLPTCRIRGNGLSSELPIIISRDNTKLDWN